MKEYTYKIRPHHGLCLGYFRGKGYNDAFTKNMANIKIILEENPLICITAQTDAICEKCPNNIDGICTTEEKVVEYDRQVLQRCHISDGEILHYHDFNELVQKNILQCNQRKEICPDCQWNSLCTN
ncbi:MAG: DUF1284 domain-containing protein [Lachnospiraceae bacterium]|nr:DUF1284 domain-containing protein [Lachnospiraceae bacterium]